MALAKGSWWLTSKSDPRWNAKGRGKVGAFLIPTAAQVTLKLKKKRLNQEPPRDLELGYMKD